jgi:flavin-dependent dehydrogenase
MLIENAGNSGVEFRYKTSVLGPITEGRAVKGVKTENGDVFTDLVIDAAGIFSPLRTNLPKHFLIENTPKYGDVFYAYRAYFNKTLNVTLEAPFEVYLRHEGELGLSWFYTSDNWVDILIGRTSPLTPEKVKEQLTLFRQDHPWFGDEILHGGQYGVIPVRRPLTLMVADGYAAIGDSAFMTTPMNGMGIDLSIEAGRLLADTVFHAESDQYTADILWEYNRDFHMLFGADTAKNEGLKNALLTLPSYGVDFLFEQDVIQSSDLSGAGRNMNFAALIGKLSRGMKRPPFFGEIVNGLIHGSSAAKQYASPPFFYDLNQINDWNKRIRAHDISVKPQ